MADLNSAKALKVVYDYTKSSVMPMKVTDGHTIHPPGATTNHPLVDGTFSHTFKSKESMMPTQHFWILSPPTPKDNIQSSSEMYVNVEKAKLYPNDLSQ